MAHKVKGHERAASLLARLSPKGQRSACDFIEYLADREDLDLLEDEDAVAEDLALFERVKQGDLSGTVPLEDVCKRRRRSRPAGAADVPSASVG